MSTIMIKSCGVSTYTKDNTPRPKVVKVECTIVPVKTSNSSVFIVGSNRHEPVPIKVEPLIVHTQASKIIQVPSTFIAKKTTNKEKPSTKQDTGRPKMRSFQKPKLEGLELQSNKSDFEFMED